MNPYAPQDRPFQERPAQQVPVRPAVQQYRPSQQFPAQQMPASRRPQQFDAQQRGPQQPSWPPAPVRRTAFQHVPVQQAPFRQSPLQQTPVRQLPVVPAALPYQPAPQPAARRTPHPALVVAFGVLVAALVVTTVMLVQGSKGQQPVQSADTPPTPPVVISTTPTTTEPKTTDPTTTEPTTTEPTTTEPTTTEPTTTEPTTTEPTTTEPKTTEPTGEAAVIRGARAAAAAWALAVNDGDTEGVRAHSCRQDLRVYDSGDLTNPGRLGGKYTFKIQKLVALTGTDTAAVVRFAISPELGSSSTLDSYVTQQSGRWLVCISVTERADL